MARKKLTKEMDFVRLIKFMRKLHVTSKMQVYTEDQKAAIKNSKFKLLTLDLYKEPNESGGSDDEIKKVKQMELHEATAFDLFASKAKRPTMSATRSHKSKVVPYETDEKRQAKFAKKQEVHSIDDSSRIKLNESIDGTQDQHVITNVSMLGDGGHLNEEKHDNRLNKMTVYPSFQQKDPLSDEEADRKIDLEADGAWRRNDSPNKFGHNSDQLGADKVSKNSEAPFSRPPSNEMLDGNATAHANLPA